MRAACMALLLILATSAWAERPVYRGFDASGGVVYSDRPGAPGSQRLKLPSSAGPSAAEYDAAVLREEADRLYYQRLAGPRPRSRSIQTPAATTPPEVRPAGRFRGILDPGLPDSPPPSLERRYYYDGR
jgi:hypothetical protein